MDAAGTHPGPALRPLLGLMMAGYGALALVGVLPHDAPVAAAASLAIGLALLATGVPALPRIAKPRALVVAALGCCCVGGTLGYALARRDGLGGPEWAIVVYGGGLMAASLALDRNVGRVAVASAVGWSFPLALAPLSLFALNAVLSAHGGAPAAAPVVEAWVVQPTAVLLRLLGTPVHRVGSSLLLATPRGTLSLGVGLVCAGLYPAVLFGGLVALQAWQGRLGPAAAAGLVGSGLAGLWVVNLLRLVLLARIGIAWGMGALQAAHANLGWILFSAFMALFWRVALRPATGDTPAPCPNTA